MSISPSSFETARYLLAMAQEDAEHYAKQSKVPITVECGIAESERKVKDVDVKGYEVTVRFFVPNAIADEAASDASKH